MRLLNLTLFLLGISFALAGLVPSNGQSSRRISVNSLRSQRPEPSVESLCARMHNNTAFIGVQPFTRLLVDSASKCQKSCMELHPKCTAVVFYYVFGESVNHICFLFDKNSVNENVALVPEKPRNNKDVVRALEIVENCHEFDPFPPLPEPFVFSSDIVSRDKRAVGFDKPIRSTGPWSQWSSCKVSNTQIRSQTCEYGRKIQKRQCAPRYPPPTQPVYTPPPTAPTHTTYPPNPYTHPTSASDEFNQRMLVHKKQELQLCCYKFQAAIAQLHNAVPSATPCPSACSAIDAQELKGTEKTTVFPISTTPLPEWSEWCEWSMCSVTCGTGIQERTRTCLHTANGIGCLGNSVEARSCDTGIMCRVWGEWCEWHGCSVTCGTGERTRERICELGFKRCDAYGETYEVEACDAGPCSEWTPWNEWSRCTATCGGGMMQRYRSCSGSHCPGESMEQMACNTQMCPCWTTWGPWSECSVSCGNGGTKSRSRSCEGNGYCEGNPSETVPCPQAPCAEWSQWTQWTQCSVTCGQGTQNRDRFCAGGNYCMGENTQQQSCTQAPCAFWSDWDQWSQCSATCGAGTRTRKRTCNGYNCPGPDQEQDYCNGSPCPTWEQWGHWSQCSVTCGMGMKTRDRTCIGGYCPGERTQQENCEMPICSFWGQWEPWSECSVTCGDGTKTHRRMCQYGTDCMGLDSETTLCMQPACPSWTEWGLWSDCSAQCGPGQKTRERQCMSAYQTPSEGCIGLNSESLNCDAGPCCQWSEWCGWSACDSDCGGGKKLRQRFCQRPGFGGELVTDASCGCPGSDKQIEDCNQHKCPPVCNWTEWCPWSQCPSKNACKNAEMTRIRQCVGEGGCKCYGIAEEKQFCRRDAVCDPPASNSNIRRRR